jgi:tRNA nucleotidyltransferase (CCA-adding enzyme)
MIGAEMTSIGEDVSGTKILERLRELPGGDELLAAAREHDGEVELVGGAVRDILLGGVPRELDVVVEGDVRAFADELASRMVGVRSVANGPPPARAGGIGEMEAPVDGDGGEDGVGDLGGRGDVGGQVELTYHERFHTAVMRWSEGEIDIAMRRSETYTAPGALPEVAAGSAQQDLERRDFTINAVAVALAGEQAGQLRSVEGALEDLTARRLRVLHDASFSDDPTRILRLVRYAARLGFEIEPHTSDLLAAAIAGGAVQTLSGQRLGAELRLALAESEPLGPLAELERLGVLRAWQPGVSFDEALARAALQVLPKDGSVRLLLAASLLLGLCHELDREETEPAMRGFLHDLELPAGEGDRAFGMAVSAVFVSDHVDGVEMLSEVLELMLGTPVESLALAAARCQLRDGPSSYGVQVIDEWLTRRRHIALEVTGDDLLAVGVPEGPEVGARLEESYRLLLEERIEPGRESELRAALEARI